MFYILNFCDALLKSMVYRKKYYLYLLMIVVKMRTHHVTTFYKSHSWDYTGYLIIYTSKKDIVICAMKTWCMTMWYSCQKGRENWHKQRKFINIYIIYTNQARRKSYSQFHFSDRPKQKWTETFAASCELSANKVIMNGCFYLHVHFVHVYKQIINMK